jgi:ABC-type multidrug transport system fused ATPase/permease subunit
MVCKECGRSTTNENANFCEYCGSSFRENLTNQYFENNTGGNTITKAMSETSVIDNAEQDKPISFLNWLGSMLLPFIPIVGLFIYPVMLLVWSFGSDTPKSKKNWARATLVVIIIFIILFIFMFTSTMMDIMSSGLNIEDYMNQFYELN